MMVRVGGRAPLFRLGLPGLVLSSGLKVAYLYWRGLDSVWILLKGEPGQIVTSVSWRKVRFFR